MRPTKIISGCQTGVDQAGLFAAEKLGIPTGGWMPFAFRTDEGNRPDLARKFGLKQTKSSSYPERTRLNVEESDGTVWFGRVSPGYWCTKKYIKSKPWLENPTVDELRRWADENRIRVLNVAGNRRRSNPEIRIVAYNTIIEAFGGQS